MRLQTEPAPDSRIEIGDPRHPAFRAPEERFTRRHRLEIARRWRDLEARRRELFVRLGDLSDERLRARPAPGHWSALEVVHHLLLVEELGLEQLLDPQAASGIELRFPPPVGRLLTWMLFRWHFRAKVPVAEAEPRGEVSLADIARRWHSVRQGFADCLRRLRSTDFEQTLAVHPCAGPLKATELVSFLLQHFDHHRGQLSRCLAFSRGHAAACG